MNEAVVKSSKISSLPDEILDVIFHEASYVEGERLNSIVKRINESPVGVSHDQFHYPVSNNWLRAVRIRASIVLVCHRKKHRLSRQRFIFVCLGNPQRFAGHIRVLDTPSPYPKYFFEEVLPLCVKLKRFELETCFEQPSSIFALMPEGIQDLSLRLTLREVDIFADYSIKFHCLEILKLTLSSDWDYRDSRITKIYLPNARTFILKCNWLSNIPLSFSCPRLQNLIVEPLERVLFNDHLFSDTSEISYISIEYTTLAIIEQKNPNTLLHSSLQRVCLSISPDASLSDISFLSAAKNMHTFSLKGYGLHDVGEVIRLSAFLSDKRSTPKLSAVYFNQLYLWHQSNSSNGCFVDLLLSLRERGIRFFVQVGIMQDEEYIEVQSQDMLLQLFNPKSTLYKMPMYTGVEGEEREQGEEDENDDNQMYEGPYEYQHQEQYDDGGGDDYVFWDISDDPGLDYDDTVGFIADLETGRRPRR